MFKCSFGNKASSVSSSGSDSGSGVAPCFGGGGVTSGVVAEIKGAPHGGDGGAGSDSPGGPAHCIPDGVPGGDPSDGGGVITGGGRDFPRGFTRGVRNGVRTCRCW